MDSSGIEFFYVSEPRPLEAGIITMGHHVNNAMIIPPHIERYDVFGKCGSLCTSEVSSITSSIPIIVIAC